MARVYDDRARAWRASNLQNKKHGRTAKSLCGDDVIRAAAYSSAEQLISSDISAALSMSVSGDPEGAIARILTLLGRYAQCERAFLAWETRTPDGRIDYKIEFVQPDLERQTTSAMLHEVFSEAHAVDARALLTEAESSGELVILNNRGFDHTRGLGSDVCDPALPETFELTNALVQPVQVEKCGRAAICLVGRSGAFTSEIITRALLFVDPLAQLLSARARRLREIEEELDVLVEGARIRKTLAAQKAAMEAAGALAAICIVDRSGDIIDVNDRFCAISEFDRSELIGRNPRILSSGRHERAFFRQMWETLEAGSAWRGDICNRKKSGAFYWVDTAITPIVDESGETVFACAQVDVTRRVKDASRAERFQREMARGLGAVRAGSFERSLHEGIVRVDKSWRALLGDSSDQFEFEQEDYDCLLHPDDLIHRETAIREHERGERDHYCVTLRMRTSANSWIEVCETGEIVERDETGRPLLIAGLLVDVTQRSSAQQFFVGMQRRLTSAFDLASDPLAILTSRGEFQLSNKSFGALLGHTSDALLDRSVLDFISADDRSEAEASLNAAWKEGASRQFRCRVESCDLGHRFLDCSVTPIDGFLYLSARDVTEAIRTENELKQALEKAERSDSAKSLFIANVSHELRTPLNGIIGLTDALIQKDFAESERETLALIKSSGETLSLLIEDLLDMAQIESGRLRLRPQEFKPAEMIEETCELLRAKALSKDLDIRVDADSTAYSAIVADKLRLRQVLTNLVSNAIKFTESGQVLIRARIVSEGSQSHLLEVVVRDTGIGISGEARERLFRRFEQADQSIGRRFGGTGLGLAISKSIVDAMGGVITLESVVGVGSTFTVRVPVEGGAVDVAHTDETELINSNVLSDSTSCLEAESACGSIEAQGPSARLSVLVADDNETNWRVLRALCSGLQADMTWANDGAKAVALCAEKKYDLILMDMQMPMMDGLQATRAIRQIEKRTAQERTPIITLTANSESSHVDAAFLAGSDAFVRKPITTKTLFAGIAEGFARCERMIGHDVRATSQPRGSVQDVSR